MIRYAIHDANPFAACPVVRSCMRRLGIYLASPVIVAGGFVIVCALALAVCIPVIWAWRRFNLSAHWNRYDEFLREIESKSLKAEKEGRKWEALKLKVAFWIVAIPMVILLYLFSSSSE